MNKCHTQFLMVVSDNVIYHALRQRYPDFYVKQKFPWQSWFFYPELQEFPTEVGDTKREVLVKMYLPLAAQIDHTQDYLLK